MEDTETINFQATFSQIQEARESMSAKHSIEIETLIDTLGSSKYKKFRSNIDKFVKDVDHITYELIENNAIANEDKNIILNSMINLNNPGYKNATAYILGYIISNGGISITKDSAKKSFKLLTKKIFDDETVDPESIVRYGRLWLNFPK